ncbi:flavin reductase family protein [Staphylococcus xylosus]|uniref:Flavin reductase family protein n=1 Tax=Staphylococcus xylosus TaxID=1288 RepID=A0A939ND02_STAXY|nr:flavin reductase family protein [Staphylococcus xylosus]
MGWISTISKDGKDNLAPYSQYQNLTWDPPMVMFAANQSVLGEHERKDTVKNAEETGWFVWNMATYDLREAVNLSAKALPPEEDEFEFAGVEKRNALKRLVTESKHLLYILSVNMSKQCVSLLAIQYQL